VNTDKNAVKAPMASEANPRNFPANVVNKLPEE